MIAGNQDHRPVRGGWGWRRASFAGAALVFAAVFGGMVLGGGSPPAADAHSFLVRTEPAEGSRLDAAPSEVSLEFSEAFDTQGARLELTIDGQDEPLTLEQGLDGRVLQADVPAEQDGVWTVSWEVVALDGHQTTGEFAFGVGEGAGDLPTAQAAVSSTPSVAQVAAGALFFFGLALAAGGLAAHWTQASRLRPGLLRVGLGAAATGALAAWLEALVYDDPTRQVLLLATAAGTLLSGLSLSRHSPTAPAAVAVAVATAAWSARGHNSVANGLIGGTVDAVHLIAATTWLGALAVLVIDLRRNPQSGWQEVVRRYARLAAILVVVLVVAGLVAAVMLLDRPSDLWSTGYGRTLAAKTMFVSAALAAATIGRQALRRGRLSLLRRAAPIEAGLLVVVLIVTAVLVNLTPPASTRAAGVSLLGPEPLTGPVVRGAGMTGHLTVAVAATSDQLRVEVLAPGEQNDDTEIEVEATFPDGGTATLLPRPCGPGCFTQSLALPDGTTRLAVAATAPDWTGGVQHLDIEMPPPADDPSLLTELTARMADQPVVEFTEVTTSGPDSNARPASFTLTGADYVELAPWAAGTAEGIQPLPDEEGFRLHLPGEPLWVTIWLDDQGRIASEEIITGRHVIERDEFVYPDP